MESNQVNPSSYELGMNSKIKKNQKNLKFFVENIWQIFDMLAKFQHEMTFVEYTAKKKSELQNAIKMTFWSIDFVFFVAYSTDVILW